MSLSFDLSPVKAFQFPNFQQQTRAMLLELSRVPKYKDSSRGQLYAAIAIKPDFMSGVANDQFITDSSVVFVICDLTYPPSTMEYPLFAKCKTIAMDVKFHGEYYRIYFKEDYETYTDRQPAQVETISRENLFIQEGPPKPVPIPINNNPVAGRMRVQVARHRDPAPISSILITSNSVIIK